MVVYNHFLHYLIFNTIFQIHHQTVLNFSYEVLFDLIHEGFFCVELEFDSLGEPSDWKYLKVNKPFEKHTGHLEKDVIGKASAELYDYQKKANNRWHERWLNRLVQVEKTGQTKQFEDSYAPLKKWVRVNLFKIGENHIGATFSDITDFREIQKALNNQRNKFQLLFDTINTGVAFYDSKGKIIDLNPAAHLLLGINQEQLNGNEPLPEGYKTIKPDGSLYPPDEHPSMVCLKNHEAVTNNVMGIINPILNKEVWVNISCIPVLNRTGLVGMVNSIENVTEEFINARKLNETNHKLEISNKNLEEFAYVASHDLREPVRTIKSFINLLFRDDSIVTSDKQKEMIKHILGGANRMEKMIQDLLSYSRLHGEMTKEKVDLNQTIENVIKGLNKKINSTNANISYKDLPIVTANKAMMERLFQNLINNAIKYTDGTDPEIKISSTSDMAYHTISVKDNGIGISPDNIKKIFTLFQRLHSQKEYEGSGIGLSVCKKIVDLHFGDIIVHSKVGEGSTFNIKLPVLLDVNFPV